MSEVAQTPAMSLTERSERARSLRRAAYLTAGLGVVHALLFLLAFQLLSTVPTASSSDAEVIEFYASSESRLSIIAGLYIMPFAGIALLWFIVALRTWISGSIRRENILFSNVQLVSGVVFIAMFFGSAAAMSVTAATLEFSSSNIDPLDARQFPEFGNTLLYVFAMRMAAVFVFTTTNIGRGGGFMPRWFVLLGYAVGLFLLLSASFNQAFVLVFPAWVIILCTLIVIQARRIPESALVGEGLTTVRSEIATADEQKPA